jgi:hypothetical protein
MIVVLQIIGGPDWAASRPAAIAAASCVVGWELCYCFKFGGDQWPGQLLWGLFVGLELGRWKVVVGGWIGGLVCSRVCSTKSLL